MNRSDITRPYRRSPTRRPSWLPVPPGQQRLRNAEALDLLRVDADKRLAEPWPEVCTAGRDCLGSAADLEHSWRPRVNRHEIVDDDRRPAVGLYIPVLLGGCDVVTADVDRT